MKINKSEILKNHCYSVLVYKRINKKLGSSFSNEKIEELIEKILNKTDIKYFEKIGKNFYITNKEYNIKITINSNTFRVITVSNI